MQLPEALVSEVKAGRVALFLGASVSFGATTLSGNPLPLGTGLQDALSNHFLGGEYVEDSLAFYPLSLRQNEFSETVSYSSKGHRTKIESADGPPRMWVSPSLSSTVTTPSTALTSFTSSDLPGTNPRSHR